MARGKIITLKYDARCRQCGAGLRAGEKARWYGRGRVYGLRCHGRNGTAFSRGDRSPGARASHYDPYGVYSVDGERLGSACGCLDYPCCGH